MTTSFAHLQFLPEQILEFDTLPSTNDYLKEIAAGGNLEEGTVVWALNQTHGKGQHLNQWISEPGQNLTLSILLKPSLLASEAFRLSKAMALAVFKTVAHFVDIKEGVVVSIKWPNDIFIANRKVAGILIENVIQGENIKQSIIGIGININQTIFHGEYNPTSLANFMHRGFELRDVVNVLLANVRSEYLQLQLNNVRKIDEDYFQGLYHVNAEQTFFIHGLLQHCFVEEVKSDGGIVLTIDGKKGVYLHGDARWKI